MITRGLGGNEHGGNAERVPPGQKVSADLRVMSTGSTPLPPVATWSLTVEGPDRAELFRCSFAELLALPATEVTVDIHCVTKWSKLATRWKGVSFDTLMRAAGREPPAPYVMASCYGGYTSNLAVADLVRGQGLVAYEHDGEPLAPVHGGPARLLVPHLYFWKSAKWVRGLRFMETNEPGFWERLGYHERGDPWKEQRYAGD
jgi:DMSO/TMAO reductase YedYZ molybdopterin-dependent catalytic subunit